MRILARHLDALAREGRLCLLHIVRVKETDAISRHAREKRIVLDLVKESHDRDAAAYERIIDVAVRVDAHAVPRNILTGQGELRGTREPFEPVREVHHRHA